VALGDGSGDYGETLSDGTEVTYDAGGDVSTITDPNGVTQPGGSGLFSTGISDAFGKLFTYGATAYIAGKAPGSGPGSTPPKGSTTGPGAPSTVSSLTVLLQKYAPILAAVGVAVGIARLVLRR
jgi:hypothetical protein